MKKLFILAVCLWCGVAQASDWANVYEQVKQAYVYEVTIEDLAVAALKGINKVDKDLRLGNDGARVTLYYKGKVIKVLRKPEDKNDAKLWGGLSDEILSAAEENSARAAGHNFETPDILAAEMVKILDKDSKFYADLDEVGGYRNKRQFAARKEGKSLYIKINTFNKQTVKELEQALVEYGDASALVLDIKGCPGGMAGEAVKVAEMFLDGGIIASTKGKTPREETYYNAAGGDVWQGKTIFILVDAETASAAEILAIALKEQGRAKVIGTLTKGKGTMQKLVGLNSGGVVAITNGFFVTPSGNELNNKGVMPDICTFEQAEDSDVEILSQKPNKVCAAEVRESSELELGVALYLLEKEIPL